MRIFIISFFKSSDLSLGVKSLFFCRFWLIFYPLDPDPGSQNLTDPTDPDPDPKHWSSIMLIMLLSYGIKILGYSKRKCTLLANNVFSGFLNKKKQLEK